MAGKEEYGGLTPRGLLDSQVSLAGFLLYITFQF